MNMQATLGPIFVPMATPCFWGKYRPLKWNVVILSTSSMSWRRVDVDIVRLLRLSRKCSQAFKAPSCGIELYKLVTSMVNKRGLWFALAGNSKSLMICRNGGVSFINDANSWSNGESMISKNLDIYTVGQSYVETIGLPGQFSLWILGNM